MHVNAWHLPNRIEEALDGFEGATDVELHVEQRLLGTAGGIHNALGSNPGAPVLVHNGDVIFCGSLRPLVEAHISSGALATLGLIRVDDPSIPRSVHCGGDGVVRDFRGDDREHGWTFSGIHVLSPELFEFIVDEGCIVADVYRNFLSEDRIHGASLTGRWADLGTIERFRAMHDEVLGDPKLLAHIRPDLTLSAEGALASIHPTVELSESVSLQEPYRIESGARIGSGAQIGPYAFVGEGACINEGATLIRTVVLPATSVKGEQIDAVCFEKDD